MFCVNQKLPDFSLYGFTDGKIRNFSNKDFKDKWWVLFFYPKDFTFICPTEVVGFNKRLDDFKKLKVEIVGISCDSPQTHSAWSNELGGVKYTLLSDEKAELPRLLNVFNENEKVPLRATFVIDPNGIIQYQVVSHNNVGRSVEETYRVVSALQTGRMCPADWKPGDETFGVENKY